MLKPFTLDPPLSQHYINQSFKHYVLKFSVREWMSGDFEVHVKRRLTLGDAILMEGHDVITEEEISDAFGAVEGPPDD